MAALKGLAIYQVNVTGKESTWRWNSLADLQRHTGVALADLANLLHNYLESTFESPEWRDLTIVRAGCRCGRCRGDHIWYYHGDGYAYERLIPNDGELGIEMLFADLIGRRSKSVRTIYLPAAFADGFMKYLKSDEAQEYIGTWTGIRALLRENARLERKYDVKPGEDFYRKVADALAREKRSATHA